MSEWEQSGREGKKLKKHPHRVRVFITSWTHWKKDTRCKRRVRWGHKKKNEKKARERETKKRFITKLNFWQKLLLYCTYTYTSFENFPTTLSSFLTSSSSFCLLRHDSKRSDMAKWGRNFCFALFFFLAFVGWFFCNCSSF